MPHKTVFLTRDFEKSAIPTKLEVDEEIADTLITLNKKGYKTLWSCSGHYSEVFSKMLRSKDKVPSKEDFLKYLEESNFKYLGEDEEDYIYEAKPVAGTPYIMFRPGIRLPFLPDNFYWEKDKNAIYYNKSIKFYDGFTNQESAKMPIEGIEQEVLAASDELKQWAEKLPILQDQKVNAVSQSANIFTLIDAIRTTNQVFIERGIGENKVNYYEYFKTGDLNVFTSINGARDKMAKVNLEDLKNEMAAGIIERAIGFLGQTERCITHSEFLHLETISWAKQIQSIFDFDSNEYLQFLFSQFDNEREMVQYYISNIVRGGMAYQQTMERYYDGQLSEEVAFLIKKLDRMKKKLLENKWAIYNNNFEDIPKQSSLGI